MHGKNGSGPSLRVAGMDAKRTMSLARHVDKKAAGSGTSLDSDKALVEAALSSGIKITRIETVGKPYIRARRPRGF